MGFKKGIFSLVVVSWFLLFSFSLNADPYPPTWDSGSGAAIHYQPVAWPSEPANPINCGDTCGDWKAYTRFQNSMNDPRTRDPSNGGTAPQSYVNVTSSCSDKAKPSVYYYLYQGATEADDVLMFRWRVESAPHNYATGPSAGSYGASNPWSSALWTVLFDVDGSGYRSLAAHLDGSSGSPSAAIDRLVGIWGNSPSHSLDYVNDANVHLLNHNPTAFVGPTGKIMNFGNGLTPTESWSNGSSETIWNYGSTRARLVSSNSCTEYFIDYQIPIAMLDASSLGGPKITRTTPIAMLFCTANSLNNPFQKDCAINKTWTADAAKAAPFGDYLSFNQTTVYSQPIIAKVEAKAPVSCPGTYQLAATVQDTLALNNGVVIPSVQSVDFYYWFDADGDGEADDAGSEWTKITPTANLVSGTYNRWAASWDASALPKGKYLIGAQALDDNTLLDDDMTPSGIDHRTFSYLTGDNSNQIYIGGNWITGQAALFPSHSPLQSPSSGENWYGNPDVTGQQLALIGTAINACGVAPAITLASDNQQLLAGETFTYTITLSNPVSNSSAITVDTLSIPLPTGFTYVTSTSVGSGGLGNSDPAISGQDLTWSYASVAISPGSQVTLAFDVTASSTSGTYSTYAAAATSFGSIDSATLSSVVDGARVALVATPSSYSIAANGSSQLTLAVAYSNDSLFALSNAEISLTLPAGINYVSCIGGTACSEITGNLLWTLGTLDAGESGTVNLVVTVPSSWTSSSLTLTAALAALAPDSSAVNKSASTTVAVTGYTQPGYAAFSLTQSASAVRIAPGGSVTYTLTYTNTGTDTAAAVVITDDVPDGMSYTSSTGGGSHSSGVVTWNIGSVAAGASASVTLTLAASSTSPFTYPNPTVNTANINWSGGTAIYSSKEVGITGNYCKAVYYFHQGVDTNIATIRPASTTASIATSAHTTTLSNISDNTFSSYTTETNQVVFEMATGASSTIDISGLTLTVDYYLSAAQGGGRSQVILRNDTQNTTIATSGELNVSTGTGSWYSFTATVPASTTINSGDKLRWYFQFRASGGKDITFHYDSTTINSRSSFCTATGPAVLSLAGSVNNTSITEATTPVLTYTLNYANTGGSSAANSVLQANIPSGLTGCEYSNNNSTWSSCSNASYHNFSLGSLASGASGTVYVRGTVAEVTQSGDVLTASPSIDSDSTNATSISMTTQVVAANPGGTPALTLLLSADHSTAVPGDAVIYTVKVINTGEATATNISIVNGLPTTSYFTYGSCTGGCVHAAGSLTWTLASLAAGSTQTYTYTMNVGSSSLAAGVTQITDSLIGTGDSGLSANSNIVTLNINGNPLLSGSMNVSPTTGIEPDSTLTYTITFSNTGTAQANAVRVINAIPAYTLYAGDPTATVGTVNFDAVNNQLIFDIGNMAAGASATLTYKASVGSLSAGTTPIVNQAYLTAENAATQIVGISANATAAPDLMVTHNYSGSSALPASQITANSNGTTIYVAATQSFRLGQWVRIGTEEARIVSYGTNTVTLDAVVTATTGDMVYGGIDIAIGYRNAGNAAATDVELSEIIPAGMEYFSTDVTPQSAPSQGSSGTVTWDIGDLVAGASGSINLVVFPAGTSGVFTHQLSLTSSNASTINNDLDVVMGGLRIVKEVSDKIASGGDSVTYTISISNSLTYTVSNIDVSDLLPAGFVYQTASATVNGSPQEPTFSIDDSLYQQPIWQNVSVAANDETVIEFVADISSDIGAGTYQNEVSVSAGAGVGIQAFDAFATTDEDVTVLGASEGFLQGYVFYRSTAVAGPYSSASDIPLANTRLEIYQSGADCSDLYSSLCIIVYTNNQGYFESRLPANNWNVKVIQGTGDLDASWNIIEGTNDSTETVTAASTINVEFGFNDATASSSSLASSEVSSSVSSDAASSIASSESDSSSSDSASSLGGGGSSIASSEASSDNSSESSSEASSSEASSEASSDAGSSSGVITSTPASSVQSSESSSEASSTVASSEASSDAASSSGAVSSVTASSMQSSDSSSEASSNIASSEASSDAGSSSGAVSSVTASSVQSSESSSEASSNVASSEASSDAASSSGTISSAATSSAVSNSSSGNTSSDQSSNATSSEASSIASSSSVVSSAATSSAVSNSSSGNASSDQSSNATSSEASSVASSSGGLSSAASSSAVGNSSSGNASSDQSSNATSSDAGSVASSSSVMSSAATSSTVSNSSSGNASSDQSSSAVSSGTSSVASSSDGLSSAATSSAVSNSSSDNASSTSLSNQLSSSSNSAGISASSSSSGATSSVATSSAMSSQASSSQSSINQYLVTPVINGGGTVTPATVQTINDGETLTFTITPDEGFEVSGVQSNCGGSLAGLSFTTEPVIEACSVEFSFRKPMLVQNPDGSALAAKTISRGSRFGFKISGGTGALGIDASVMHAGVMRLKGNERIDEFLAIDQASLTAIGNGNYEFQSGRAGIYIFEFSDESGQISVVEITVRPLVAFASSHQVSTTGQLVEVMAVLDDDPGIYPVVVPFHVINAELAEGLPSAGELIFDEERKASLPISIQANAGSIDFILQANGLEGADLGSLIQHRIALKGLSDIPLTLRISAEQNALLSWVATSSGGQILLRSGITGSGFTYDWSKSDPRLGIGNASSDTVQLNPSSLEGIYSVHLTVTETNGARRQANARNDLRIVDAIPANYQQFMNSDTELNVTRLPICLDGGMDRVAACADVLNAVYLTSLAPYEIRLGKDSDYASWRDLEFALSMETKDIVDSDGNVVVGSKDTQYNHLGYRIDFEIHGLEFAGQAIPVVVPLKPGVTIPANGVWRKYSSENGWANFVIDDKNRVASARGDGFGNCPWPGGLDWRDGLNVGDDCIRLIIEDGGPNDEDKTADAVVRDPGTLAVRAAITDVNTVGKGGGGGNVTWTTLWLMLVIFLTKAIHNYRINLMGMRNMQGKKSVATKLFFCILGVVITASAQTQTQTQTQTETETETEKQEFADFRYYALGQLGMARGEVGADEMNQRMLALGYDAEAQVSNLNRTSWSAGLGYHVNKYLDVEWRYTDLGSVRTHLRGAAEDIEAYLQSATVVHPRSASGHELAGALYWPLDDQLRVYVRAGLMAAESDYYAWANPEEESRSNSENIVTRGFGVAYDINERLGLRVSWTAFPIEDETITNWGLELLYRFDKREK